MIFFSNITWHIHLIYFSLKNLKRCNISNSVKLILVNRIVQTIHVSDRLSLSLCHREQKEIDMNQHSGLKIKYNYHGLL